LYPLDCNKGERDRLPVHYALLPSQPLGRKQPVPSSNHVANFRAANPDRRDPVCGVEEGPVRWRHSFSTTIRESELVAFPTTQPPAGHFTASHPTSCAQVCPMWRSVSTRAVIVETNRTIALPRVSRQMIVGEIVSLYAMGFAHNHEQASGNAMYLQ
jgi:hypothetical protein